MKFLRDAKILVKFIIPLAIIAFTAGGLLLYARSSLIAQSGQTRQIVDVQAKRLALILSLQIDGSEISVQARNLVLETRDSQMAGYETRIKQAKAHAFGVIDELGKLTDTAERRAANDALRQTLTALGAVIDRVVASAEQGDSELARDILLGDGNPLRAKLWELARARVEVLTTELQNERDASEQSASRATLTLVAAASIGLVVAIAAGVAVVVLGVAAPLKKLVRTLERMGRGEIDSDIAEAARGDEIGAVGRVVEGIKRMVAERAAEQAEIRRRVEAEASAERRRARAELAERFERTMGGIVGAVSNSASELQNAAQSMTDTASLAAMQAATVAAAAEEAAGNVQTVATAAEELGTSVQEIGRQITGSADLTRIAAREAGETTQLVQALNQTSVKIGEMVGLIASIASQTNLLALNATIEAARAGEAGRGFAVVASEVKELASQTAKVTDEITGQIGAIRAVTENAVAAIGGITGRIGEIDGVTASIATAVEEQGAATQEIVRNVAQAASGTGEVTSNIVGVAEASEKTGAAATQVLGAAAVLSDQSGRLNAEVARFLNGIRAA
ncbi:methyl-accepting chemotaxis protein [Methylobacterium pseudosasicola]|uniref:Methyl-accepting chemotaxis protein n=1 Tax=Methylobacterium pseudosasicola TaxID=582667 RepID=A0A1I4FHM9_9HYPH|nr:methyl-accepting chemotaxis protein [Methylobacterium pseudosasicola]SFL16953.1 Methyl-accepting chemotaxis protein [Methylobacterium pseudosasicola]